jgi:aminoglycoside 2''-phosphotransferase
MDLNQLIDQIRLAYPTLEFQSLQVLTEGQFNQILLINNELIFRFPRYAHVMDECEMRQATIDQIRSYLPLPVPEILYQSPNTGIPGEVFSVYRMLPGKPLYRESLQTIGSEDVLQRLAEQAAAFLKALHGINPKQYEKRLPVEDPLDYYEQFFSEIRTALLPRMRFSARIQTKIFFEELLHYLQNDTYRPCLIHNDFGGSNILYDEFRQELSGVIDFNSLCLGDPAVDVASLSTYGEDFVLRGFRVYPEMEHLLERARLIKKTFELEEALSGWRDGDPKAFERGMENYV